MENLLKQHFGYTTFKPLQKEIINHILSKKDALVLMPTGGGKSLCYQLPALMLQGLTLVISPLISLMKDQVDSLKENGIAATYLNSSLAPDEIRNIENLLQRKEIKILYIAPERLAVPYFLNFLQTLSVSLIAVDEAHCISEWGHDFRPEYRNVKTLQKLFPSVPFVALTATATPQVRKDIMQELSLRTPQVFLSSFDRPNLLYKVTPKKEAFKKLCNLLTKFSNESVIVYCFSRKSTETLQSKLREAGFKAQAYHAGLNHQERASIQNAFIRDEVRIIIATIAFGMGIDKPDVRLVVHYDLPKSLEGYYQETGRAGRDGLKSECVLFYSYGDVIKHNYFLREMRNQKERIQAEEKLNQMVSFCTNESCRRNYLLNYFGEQTSYNNCHSCDACMPKEEVTLKETEKQPSEKTKIRGVLREYDIDLFEQLRILRKKLADERGVPPFVIFGDKSLQDMAYRMPHERTDFLKTFGVGHQKLKEFGEPFMNAISEYKSKTNIPYEKDDRTIETVEETFKSTATHKKTEELIRNKLSLEEIAQIRSLALSTIIGHLEVLVQSEAELDIEYLKPSEDRLRAIETAFERTNSWSLSPAKNALNESYSYDEIKLARIFIKKSINPF